jgi:hypothetical protein
VFYLAVVAVSFDGIPTSDAILVELAGRPGNIR